LPNLTFFKPCALASARHSWAWRREVVSRSFIRNWGTENADSSVACGDLRMTGQEVYVGMTKSQVIRG